MNLPSKNTTKIAIPVISASLTAPVRNAVPNEVEGAPIVVPRTVGTSFSPEKLMTSQVNVTPGPTGNAPVGAHPAVGTPSASTAAPATIKTVRNRITYSGRQLWKFDQFFNTKKFLNKEEVYYVAQQVGCTALQVSVWYQNRRRKWKEQTGITDAEILEIKKEQKKHISTLIPRPPRPQNCIKIVTKDGIVFQSVAKNYNGPSHIWLN